MPSSLFQFTGPVKKYFVFEFDSVRYCYNVLPFGLTSSPCIFTKMLKPVINYLRCKRICTSAYLDDIFISSPSASLLKQLNFTLSLLISLGFTPNYSKSHLIPIHEIIHLGYSWDFVRMSISLPKR